MREIFLNIKEWEHLIYNTIRNTEDCPSEFEKKFCRGNQFDNIWFSPFSIRIEAIGTTGKSEYYNYMYREIYDWFMEKEEDL